MKFNQVLYSPLSFEFLPAFEDKNPLDKVLSQIRSTEPAIILNRSVGKLFHERLCEKDLCPLGS